MAGSAYRELYDSFREDRPGGVALHPQGANQTHHHQQHAPWQPPHAPPAPWQHEHGHGRADWGPAAGHAHHNGPPCQQPPRSGAPMAPLGAMHNQPNVHPSWGVWAQQQRRPSDQSGQQRRSSDSSGHSVQQSQQQQQQAGRLQFMQQLQQQQQHWQQQQELIKQQKQQLDSMEQQLQQQQNHFQPQQHQPQHYQQQQQKQKQGLQQQGQLHSNQQNRQQQQMQPAQRQQMQQQRQQQQMQQQARQQQGQQPPVNGVHSSWLEVLKRRQGQDQAGQHGQEQAAGTTGHPVNAGPGVGHSAGAAPDAVGDGAAGAAGQPVSRVRTMRRRKPTKSPAAGIGTGAPTVVGPLTTLEGLAAAIRAEAAAAGNGPAARGLTNGTMQQQGPAAGTASNPPPLQQQQQLRVVSSRYGGVSTGAAGASAASAAAQPAGKAAGKAADGTIGANSSNDSPYAYFRRHVTLTNPFWASATADAVGLVAFAHLPPIQSAWPAGGSGGSRCTLTVELSSSQTGMLQARTATLQLWCLLINDAVPCRVHWPANATLLVNGQHVNPYHAKRLSVHLQPQQVDQPVDISKQALAAASHPAMALARKTTFLVKLLGSSKGGGYVLGARLVRQQSVAQIKRMMMPAPSLEAALARVQEKLSCDDDDDIVVATTTVSLRCPLSSCRISMPAHFSKHSSGLSCFDLDSFLEVTQRRGKWQCPISMAISTVQELQEEPWLSAVLRSLKAAGLADTVDEVEVSPDGTWRPKGNSGEHWFSVLQPPTKEQLHSSLSKPTTAADNADAKQGNGRKRSFDAADAADLTGCGTQQQQEQPAKKQKVPEAVDLTLDSDADEPQQKATPARAAAAGTCATAAAAAAAGDGGDNTRTPLKLRSPRQATDGRVTRNSQLLQQQPPVGSNPQACAAALLRHPMSVWDQQQQQLQQQYQGYRGVGQQQQQQQFGEQEATSRPSRLRIVLAQPFAPANGPACALDTAISQAHAALAADQVLLPPLLPPPQQLQGFVVPMRRRGNRVLVDSRDPQALSYTSGLDPDSFDDEQEDEFAAWEEWLRCDSEDQDVVQDDVVEVRRRRLEASRRQLDRRGAAGAAAADRQQQQQHRLAARSLPPLPTGQPSEEVEVIELLSDSD